MDLTPYVEALRSDLQAAAAAGGEQAASAAQLLGVALDASVRLCLVDVMSAMAAEVTAASDATAVEIRMHGREPQVVVAAAEPDEPADLPPAADPGPVGGDEPEGDDGGGTARITLRLPESLKAQAEAAAAAHGLSVNSWLVRCVAASLSRRGERIVERGGPGGRGPLGGRRLTGYARS
jgi:hypothetical protein